MEFLKQSPAIGRESQRATAELLHKILCVPLKEQALIFAGQSRIKKKSYKCQHAFGVIIDCF